MKNLISRILLLAAIFLLAPVTAFAQSTDATRVGITQFTSGFLLVVVVIGVIVNLWKTTRKYGGIVGNGLRLVGTGMVFLSVEALDRAAQSLGNAGVIASIITEKYQPIVHDLLLVIALFFVALGFIKFHSVTK
ncbi:MAG: hypothetical protein COT91_05000 [Candidatus Doudnabacteria bacterium CG10_big_fil_rev_8_21_14_0_10_41_10]|uniref:MotA/TolQ/ExbB proton channel domain-containing protein n=1 Tax=Candidatus Doudnabacteria bacterium CG10_big_fil_rev_8_21_14_0_10_41_10 TaxID=1974551 RepID=A0A2H0VCD8_9BACT|nr:MAG: hypothetical protein COT91_05000 [Candidatus Doudnabacteria bacterium CG10_big_fil_rev_8_21_14_0_10_41_10]